MVNPIEIMYKTDLDEMKCHGGCPTPEDPLYLHAKCHPEAPTWTAYYNGFLKIICSKCKKEIIVIAIAKKEGQQ